MFRLAGMFSVIGVSAYYVTAIPEPEMRGHLPEFAHICLEFGEERREDDAITWKDHGGSQ
jgi:hypothetical protein